MEALPLFETLTAERNGVEEGSVKADVVCIFPIMEVQPLFVSPLCNCLNR